MLRTTMIIAMAASLAGCARAPIGDYLPEADYRFASGYLRHFPVRDFAAAEMAIHPGFRSDEVRRRLREIARFFPQDEQPHRIELTAARRVDTGAANRVEFSFQLDYATRWLLVDMTVERRDGTRYVTGLHITPLEYPLQSLHAFTWKGKTPVHYLAALATGLVGLFIAGTVTFVVRRGGSWKWLWAAASVVGLGQFSVNWTTGAWLVEWPAYLLFGVGLAQSSVYEPPLLSFSIPVGALAYWAWSVGLRKGRE